MSTSGKNLAEYCVELRDSKTVDVAFESEWCTLFSQCFETTQSKAKMVFRKYHLNTGRFAILRLNSRIVACYSGTELECSIGRIFLATDTMSDGSRSKATVLLGKTLYKELKEDGVIAVVGFPNKKIQHIREKYLGWTMNGKLHVYISLPFLWKITFPKQHELTSDLWSLRRPHSGSFGRLPPFVRLVCRGKSFSGLGLPVTLSSTRPGPFFLRVPAAIVAPRLFGYRILGNQGVSRQLNKLANRLDLETIDVP